jgi:hypothetical protein
MQFKVPQNVDMQDRIIGPLTLSQFFYLLFGGVIIYILFGKLAVNGYGFFFWILALPIGAFSFAMAFLKVQDRPFPMFFMAMIKYLTLPRARVWQHYSAPTPTQKKPVAKKAVAPPKKQLDPIQVRELADILDTDGSQK